MAKLRLGIVINDLLVPAWQSQVINSVLNSDHTHLSVLILNPPPPSKPLPFLLSLFKSYDNKKQLQAPDATRLQDVSSLVKNTPVVDTSSAAIKELDAILDLSEAPISNSLLSLPPHGILSYYFGSTENKDAVAAYEVLTNKPILPSGLKMKTAGGEEKIIYRSFSLTDPSSMKRSLNRCYWKSAAFPARMLKLLHDDPAAFNNIDIIANPIEDKELSNTSFAFNFISKTAKRVINRLKRGNTRRDWILMYNSACPPGRKIDLRDFKKLQAPRGFFWADPMVVKKNNTNYIFFEEYVYAAGRGRISVITQNEDGSFTPAQPILDKPYHLSYPFVFQVGDKWYMIPETSENRTIDLYECVEFPHKWELKRTLIKNISAADSTVIYHKGRWWLFTCVEEVAGSLLLDELSIFYTDDIINSELVAHPQNPVVSDVRRARPAGPLYIHNGSLYRPSQICAPWYGWGISINRVTKLSETEYEEQPGSLIRPELPAGIRGVHTLSYAGDLCIIDAIANLKK